MSISNYDCIPFYYWYKAESNYIFGNRIVFSKGIRYIGFANEVDKETVIKYGLKFVGGGDIEYIS